MLICANKIRLTSNCMVERRNAADRQAHVHVQLLLRCCCCCAGCLRVTQEKQSHPLLMLFCRCKALNPSTRYEHSTRIMLR